MSDPLSDLLNDYSTNSRRREKGGGGFLSTLKKSQSTYVPDQKISSSNVNTYQSNDDPQTEENTYNKKKGIEVDDNVDTFNKSNNTGERMLTNTGSEFFTPAINDFSKPNNTSIGFFQSKNEPVTLDNFGVGRKHSQIIEKTVTEKNQNEDSSHERFSFSPEKRPIYSRSNTNFNPTPTHKDKEDDVSPSTLFSKESRRTRGSFLLSDNNINTNSSPTHTPLNANSNSRSGSQEKGTDNKSPSNANKDDELSSISFSRKEEINTKTTETDNEPKSLLKHKSTNFNKIQNFPQKNNNVDIIDEEDENTFSPKFKSLSNANDASSITLMKSNPDKFFHKQETNVSFRDNSNNNNQEQGDNIGKLRIEKDYYESQIATYKKRAEEDKARYDALLNDEREKYRKSKEENSKFLNELRVRHKEELLSIEENYKSIVSSLNDDNRKIRSEIDKEIQNERERMQIIHKSDLENQENGFKRNMEQQKKFNDEQNDMLKKQLQQQIEFNKLASKVELSSKQMDDILQKFYNDRDKNVETEKSTYENKERFLREYEDKLKDFEKSMNIEKEAIVKMRQDSELRDLEKRRDSQEEKVRLDKEISRLQELQNSLKVLEYNAKEKYERERLEINQKHNDMKSEMDTIKNDYHQKLNEVDYQKKIFVEEKNFFDKYKDEALKNIEIKKSNLEDRKRQFYEEEKEIKGRIKILQEKEYYIREKYEEFERVKIEIEETARKTDKDRRDLMIAAKRIEEDIRVLDEKNRIFEKEKEEVLKRFQEFEGERSMINSEKLKVEQAKAELRLRLQSMDMLRMKYVNTMNNNNTPSVLDLRPTSDNNPFQPNPSGTMSSMLRPNQTMQATMHIEANRKIDDLRQSKQSFNSRRSFNADEYMQNLKLKLGDKDYGNNYNYNVSNTNFNNYLHQEREYLKTQGNNRQTEQETNIKKEYEKLSQQHFKNTNMSMNMYEVNDVKDKTEFTKPTHKRSGSTSGLNYNFKEKEDKAISLLNKSDNHINNDIEVESKIQHSKKYDIPINKPKTDYFDKFDEVLKGDKLQKMDSMPKKNLLSDDEFDI